MLRDCGESLERVWGLCWGSVEGVLGQYGEIVWRLCGKCGESVGKCGDGVGRLWGVCLYVRIQCGYMVGRVCIECGDSGEIVGRVLGNVWKWCGKSVGTVLICSETVRI